MRIFYNLIIFTMLTTLSGAGLESADIFSHTLDDGSTFQARHPHTADPYFSYNDHTLTININPLKQSSLWNPSIGEDWFVHHKKEMILFFMVNSDGNQECIGFFWTQLGGPLTFKGVPEEIVKESFKRLIDFEF